MKPFVFVIMALLCHFHTNAQSKIFKQYLEFNGATLNNGGQAYGILDDPKMDVGATDELSVQCWLNPNQFSTTAGVIQGIITKRTASGTGYGLFWEMNNTGTQGRLRFKLKENSASGGQSKTISSQYISNIQQWGWQHITITFGRHGTSDTLKLYINGIEEEKIGFSGIQDMHNNRNLYLMRYALGSTQLCAGGLIDEVRIWNTALTPEFIKRSYTEPINETSDGFVRCAYSERKLSQGWSDLLVYLHMDSLDPSHNIQLYDESQNQHTGFFESGGLACTVPACGSFCVGQGSASYLDRNVYLSNLSGNWSSGSTWKGNVVPNSHAHTVIVHNTHQLQLDQNSSVDHLIIGKKASLSSLHPNTLHINQSIDNFGKVDLDSTTVSFKKDTNQYLFGKGTVQLYALELEKSQSKLFLQTKLSITHSLTLKSGVIQGNNLLWLTQSSGPSCGVITPSGGGSIHGNILMQAPFTQHSGWLQVGLPLQGTISDFQNLALVHSNQNSTQNANVFYWDHHLISGSTNCKGWTAAPPNSPNDKAYTIFLDSKHSTQDTVFFNGVYTPGDQTYDLSYANSPTNPISMGQTGYENGVGWNFIPNAFPSLLDAQKMIAESPLIYPNIHVWDAQNQQYRVFTSLPTSIKPYNNAGSSATIGTNFQTILPFQGFWVKTSSATEANAHQFVLKDSWRSADFAKTPFPGLKQIDAAHIYVVDHATQNWDGVLIYFDESGEKSFNPILDAFKVRSPAEVPHLSIHADQRLLSVKTMSPKNHSVKLVFEAPRLDESRTYRIELNSFELNQQWQVVLEDVSTNTKVDLIDQAFVFNTRERSKDFILHFNKNGRIPLDEFGEFSIRYSNDLLEIVHHSFEGTIDLQLTDASGRSLHHFNGHFNGRFEKTATLPYFFIVSIATPGQTKHYKVCKMY